MLSLLRLIPWQTLMVALQAGEDPAPAEITDPADETKAASEAEGEGMDGEVPVGEAPELPADAPAETLPVETPPVETLPAEPPVHKSSDPIEALSDTAETATEAASQMLSWIGSGQREALIAVALITGLTILQWFIRWGVLKGIVRIPRVDDYSITAVIQRVIKRIHVYFMVAVAFAITDAVLALPAAVSGFVKIVVVLASVLQLAEMVQEFAVSAIQRNVHRNTSDAVALASAYNVIKWFIMVVVWSIALLLILSNIGTDVTALLAGLGIGGVAIGFAAQGVFRDVFSSLSIVIDKPFQVGDMVRYNDTWGAIEEIGLKTTRIRARSGEQIVISNTNLLDCEIHNMARMARRRIETGFGVIYQTDPALAEQIPDIVAEVVKSVQGVEFERCGMSGFGPSSLDYDVSFFSLHPDYNRSMAARSRVLLALLAAFKKFGIEFAYPTQTLFIEGVEQPAEPIRAIFKQQS